MSRKLSRREFLKLSSVTLGAAAFTTLSPTDWRIAQRPTGLGRVTIVKARVLNRPNRLGDTVGYVDRDEVLEVYRHVVGEGFYPHNHVWVEIAQGFVYSSWVQPVKNEIQTPLTALPPDGVFAEVSVPYTQAYIDPDPKARLVYFSVDPSSDGSDTPEYKSRLYYSAVFKIDQIQTDAQGGVWYRVQNDQFPAFFWVPGHHLRVITPEEISPISPDVTDKTIIANVRTNWLMAYEGKTEVFRTRIASGASFFAPDGSEHAGIKAGGTYNIYSKRVSRHMAGGVYPNGYDLPGIAWVSYWHAGAAIHSTYWHNDFGRPRSHGCLNCTPEAAKWLFRWSLPAVDYNTGKIEVTWEDRGSIVDIQGEPEPVQDDSG
jgi:hypothetical protein